MPTGALPVHWGVRPVLFWVGAAPVPAYEALVLLGLAAGASVIAWNARRRIDLGGRMVAVLVAALVGGALGAKLPIWVMGARDIVAAGTLTALLSGRTVVGGLIGGTLAAIAVRRRLGVCEPLGNLFAPGIALGLAVGRVGCFLRGCCHGVPSGVPWAVGFGDGVGRHPTQLYEAAFLVALFGALQRAIGRDPAPGALFRTFMLAYFLFRFCVEFLRAGPRLAGGLTAAQVAAAAVVAAYLFVWRRAPAPDAPQAGAPARGANDDAHTR